MPADGARPARRCRASGPRRAGLRLEPSAAPEEIAAAARGILADGSYRRAAERIAAAIAEETATDLALAEIEAVVATAPQRGAVTA